MTVTKPDLAELIAQRCGVSQATGAQALNDLLDRIAEEIAQGGAVSITGFGSFSRRRRAAGKTRHLHTGEPLEYGESLRPHFAPGKSLRDRVRSAAA